MSDINTITNLRNNHDKSINFISKELGINWRTAKKYADGDVLPRPTIDEVNKFKNRINKMKFI